jgi:hypothetical protein
MKRAMILFACWGLASGGLLAETGDKTQKELDTRHDVGSTAAVPAKDTAAKKAEASFVPGGMPKSFIIPSNTCEQGTPLQKLLRDKPRESK